MIPYFNITPQDEERQLLLDAFDSGWWSSGKYVDIFERELGDKLASPVLTVSNGTVALILAYMALGLQPGDEVIVPGWGFMAAANVAKRLNLKPIFVDVRSDTWCLDTNEIEQCITAKTKAIVPIHTYGVMCHMSDIMKLSDKHGIKIIEDCAESLLSNINYINAGNWGHIGTYSFQATKTITTGEGGAVSTNYPYLYETMKIRREHGLEKRGSYDHIDYGLNFRLTDLQAAIGVAQLTRVQQKINRRNQIASYYRENIKPQSQLHPVGTNVWVFAFRWHKRRELTDGLKSKGIETRPGFLAPDYMNIHHAGRTLPISNILSREVISLPTYPELTDGEVEYICQTVNQLL